MLTQVYVNIWHHNWPHWGRVMHICVGKITIIGSNNGLSPRHRQAIIWANAGTLLIRTLGTNFSEILSKIHTFSAKKMHMKMSSADMLAILSHPQCVNNGQQDCMRYHGTPRVILTNWGGVTHICFSKLTIIGSDNGLLPDRHQAIIRTNDGILLIGPLGTNFSELLIEILLFSFKKMRLKMSFRIWQSFCLGLNVLNTWPQAAPNNHLSGPTLLC